MIVLHLQKTVISIAIVTLFMAFLLVLVNIALRKYDPLSKPKGLVLLMIMAVEFVENLVRQACKKDELVNRLSPYFATVILYIFLSNISGLFNVESPTANYSVTLTLAIISVLLIEGNSIKYNSLKGYIKGLFEPFAPFFVMNVFSKLSTLLSLSLRLFGNILAGGVLMSIIYQLLAKISSFIPVIGNFNVIALVVAPFLHFYFDLFSGVMQAYIFTTLSVSFIGNELPES